MGAIRNQFSDNPVWTEERIALLRELWPAGVDRKVIAERIGLTPLAIKSRAADLGLHRPDDFWRKSSIGRLKPNVSTFWTAELEAKAAELWREGHSAGEIAAEIGCSRNTVSGKLHRLGLFKSRPDSERTLRARMSRQAAKPRQAKAQRATKAPKPRTPKPANDSRKVIAMQPPRFGQLTSPEPIPATPVSTSTPPDNAIPWASRTGKECAFPYGDLRTGLYCCPEPAVFGHAYCMGHGCKPGLYAFRPRLLAGEAA